MARVPSQRVATTRLDVIIDQLAFEVLGSDANGIVETTLDLNPGLAARLRSQRHRLALGQSVRLPEQDSGTRRTAQVTLWS